MSTTRLRRTALTAVTLVTAAVSLVGLTGPTASASAPAASARAALPGCVARDLDVSLGRLDAGAGQRYQDLRIANVSDHDCRLTGYPVFRFAAGAEPIGFRSQHQGQPVSRVRLEVGDSAWTTLWWTDPGPVPAADCDGTTATALRLTLPARAHLFRLALDSRVCTSRDYRPVAYPIRDRAVY